MIEPRRFCEHTNIELRMRTIANGQRRPERQCVDCGSGRGAAPKASVKGDLPEWDYTLADAVEAERREFYQQQQQSRSDEWWRRYHEHLASAKWQTIRRKVISRANNVCEGCGEGPIHDVHHLTYDHVCNEFLWELRGVCRDCHERFHGHPIGSNHASF